MINHRITKWTYAIMLLLASCQLAHTQPNNDKKQMETSTKTSLHYLVRQPKIKTDHPPVIIMLHGVGSNEKDLFSLANQLPDHFLVVAARGPITLSENSFAWFQVQFTPDGPAINASQAESSRQQLLRFIDELAEVEHFDKINVYLLGFSQGGIMSYSVALTHPEKVKGIAIMSSRLLPEVKPLVASSNELKNLKVFISHGTQDQVLKFQYALDAVAYLESKNVIPEFHEYPEGHTINSAMLQDVISWLNK